MSPEKGGPAPKLDVDGLVGPKTIGAIQKFQLHHFGFKGADGRVDPDGATLAKLNELASPVGPVEPVVTGSFTLRQATAAARVTDPRHDFFFQIQDFEGGQKVRYFFKPIGPTLPGAIPVAFPGLPKFFGVSPPVSIFALGGPAVYSTIFKPEGPESFLMFTPLKQRARVVSLNTHLPKGAGKKLSGDLGKSTPDREDVSGILQTH